MIDFDKDVLLRFTEDREDATREATAKLIITAFQYMPASAQSPETDAVMGRIVKHQIWQHVYGDLYHQLITLRNQLVEAGAIPTDPSQNSGVNEAISKALAMIGPPSSAVAELVGALTKEGDDART